MFDKSTIISSLNLEPHPEGGFFKRTMTTDHNQANQRFATTCIYFLIEHGNPSSLHKLDTDEYWMYHCGTSDILIKGFAENDEDEKEFSLQAGPSCMQWQLLIPRETWFGARTIGTEEGSFALLSCICTPGFDFSGFTLGNKSLLKTTYPRYANLINEMCP